MSRSSATKMEANTRALKTVATSMDILLFRCLFQVSNFSIDCY